MSDRFFKICLIGMLLANIPIWPISYEEIVAKNLQRNQVFRSLIAVNCLHNLINTGKSIRKQKLLATGGNLILSACSAVTVLAYPYEKWYSYCPYTPITKQQSVYLSLIAIVSCLDAALAKTILTSSEDKSAYAWPEKIVKSVLCLSPFYESCAYTIKNIY